MGFQQVKNMYKFKIERLDVKTAQGNLEIVPKRINVLVGPNNSGKSRVLKEIRDYLSGDCQDIKMINDIKHPFPSDFSEFDDAYDVTSKMVRDQHGNWILKEYSNKPNQMLDMSASLESYYTRTSNAIGGDWRAHFESLIEDRNIHEFFNWCGSLFFQYMGTEERLTICKTQRNYGLDSNNTNFLSSFRFQEELLYDLSEKIKLLFGKDIFLDSQTLGDRVVFRVGEDFDYVRKATTFAEETARKLFEEKALDDQGDGIKSFVATFLSLYSNSNDILLIDEPEAFLHPPLARQLGEMIGEYRGEDCTVFIATHSIEILKGILSKTTDVNVVRITQPSPQINNIKVLDQTILDSILKEPILRVSRVLEGVFCDRVIITEAEADELVYQELLEKIVPESGLFFAHGQNKQTLAKIASLYQEIGISYEIITDFDILRVSSELNSFLQLMPIDERKRQQIISYTDKLRDIVNSSVQIESLTEDEIKAKQKNRRDKVYHEMGIRFFEEKLRTKILQTLSELGGFHLHILPCGELETLLEEFGVTYKEKTQWVVDAINMIASLNPETINQNGTVYQFVTQIVHGTKK